MLQNSPFWEHAAELRAIGLFDLGPVTNVVHVDQAEIVFLPMLCHLFRVVFTWLAKSDGCFFIELERRRDLQEMWGWLTPFEHFLHIRAFVISDTVTAAAVGETFFHDPENEFKVDRKLNVSAMPTHEWLDLPRLTVQSAQAPRFWPPPGPEQCEFSARGEWISRGSACRIKKLI